MADAQQQDWLARLDEQARAKQEKFMAGIAKRLNRPRVTEKPAHPFRGAPDFWNAMEWSEAERIERFTGNFTSVGGHVVRLADMQEVQRFIVDMAGETSARIILRQNERELAALGLEEALTDTRVTVSVWNSDQEVYWKARAAEADFGVVMADYAVAYTGTIAVLSSENKGRSVSLLPTVLIAIIPLERLKTKLGEAFVEFDRTAAEGRSLPAGIHFITGPSRSADIENDLTIGVHGPGIVYALLVG